MYTVLESVERFVQPVGQLHSTLQKFLIAETFSAPTLHHLIDSETLFPAELLVEEVHIVNNLPHHQHLLVANVKHLDQRLKSTVLTPEAFDRNQVKRILLTERDPVSN
jgi:hypothetical protein